MMMFSMDDMVPQNHMLRLIDKAINWNFIYDLVEEKYCPDNGRPSMDPVMLIKIPFIQYLYGIKSMRQTMKEIEVNVAYRWFLGLDMLDPVPHFSTFGKNYTRRFKDTDLFEQIFSKILEDCMKYKLVNTEQIFVDATHVKACANSKKMRKRVAHEQALWYEEELNKEIEKDRLAHGKKPLKKKDDNQPPASGGTGNDKDSISEELPEDVKTQKCSISDPESGWFRKGEHKHVFAYAVETACDKHGWILGYTVHPGNEHDSRTFKALYDKISKLNPQMVVADAGYKTPAIAHQLLEDGIQPLFPYTRPKTKEGFFGKHDFAYDEYLPFYRQEKDWFQKGVPLPRETAAHWYNYCALEYFAPIYEALHQELLGREVIHADEVPCQVLHEEGKEATSKSYMWIYLSGSDGLPGIVLYDYRPGRGGENPIEFLSGFKGLLHCDGYSAYGRIEDVVLVCCLAHCRRKFYEAVPAGGRKKLKLLDINSEEKLKEPSAGRSDDNGLLPAEKGVAFCNRLFFLERCYKELPAEERKQKRQEKEPEIWNEFWSWLGTLNPTGGSKLEKAVNYAFNHKETLMNYLLDGRCEISNNAAERRAKSYATARKNFLFHDTVDGANASAIVMSLIETAKANNLNIYQYLYTLLLYMPDYKNEPAGIKQLMPWSEFIKENCSGITDTEKILPENRGDLPI